jgi:hypothetical protein
LEWGLEMKLWLLLVLFPVRLGLQPWRGHHRTHGGTLKQPGHFSYGHFRWLTLELALPSPLQALQEEV